MARGKVDLTDTGSNYKRWEDSNAYLGELGLLNGMPTWVRFYEGDQWPAKTEATKNFPRPVINVIKMICKNKRAAVLSRPVRLHFSSNSKGANCDMLDKFVEYVGKDIGQEDADHYAIGDGIKKGTYVYHYYWDASAKGFDGTESGALRVEVIDPLNIRFADPKERDEQKQAWIMIISREELDAAKEKADEGFADVVAEDTNESSYGEPEQEGTRYVTIYTRYFKENGEVFFEQSTRNGVFKHKTSLTPDMEAAMAGRDAESQSDGSTAGEAEDALPDAKKARKGKGIVFSRYPIVVQSWDERDKSIYGVGEIETLLPNQRIINSGIGLQILKLQNEAWGTTIVDPEALNGQELTNEPGKTIVDWSKTGNGIRRLQENAMSGTPLQVIQSLVELTRVVTGASEVMTGEVIGSNMSGAAIAALQSQAERPMEEQQQMFWRAKKRQGLIIAEFSKFYYEGAPFQYEMKTEGQKLMVSADFKGSDYLGADFSIVVEAGAAANFSEASDIAMLETLVTKGLISVRAMVEAYPENALANRQKLLDAIDADEKNKLKQAMQAVEQMKEQLIKASEIINKQTQTINAAQPLFDENQMLKAENLRLKGEYTIKMNAANEELTKTRKDAATLARDMDAMLKKGAGGKAMPVQTEPIE